MPGGEGCVLSGSIYIQNHPYVRILQHESQAFPRIGQLKRIDKQPMEAIFDLGKMDFEIKPDVSISRNR